DSRDRRRGGTMRPVRASLLLLLAFLSFAHASELRDGAHLRRVERLGRAQNGLAAVRWSDVATGRAAPAFVGRRAIVRLERDPSKAKKLRPLLPALNYWLVESESPEEDGLALAERLQSEGHEALPDLYFARKREAFVIPPDDARYSDQWYLQKINLEDA